MHDEQFFQDELKSNYESWQERLRICIKSLKIAEEKEWKLAKSDASKENSSKK